MDVSGFDAWLLALGQSPQTRKLKGHYVKRFMRTCDPLTCDQMPVIKFLARDDWKPQTRSAAYNCLHSLFEWLVTTKQRDESPMKDMKPPKVPRSVPKPCPEDKLEAALKVANPKAQLILLLGAYAGLRREEIASLHTDNILLEAGKLRITGKGSKTRLIPIADRLLPVLRGLELGWVFPNGRGGHVTGTTVGRIAKKSLGTHSTHSLRHRFATQVHQKSRDLRAVQALMGHSSLAITEMYLQVTDDDMVNAVGTL